MQELNLTIKQRFEAERIESASRTQTVYVKPDGGQQGGGNTTPGSVP